MILQSLKMAWKSIKVNKVRAFLTMLGVIIGVMALVVLVSLVSSTTGAVGDKISSMGTNVLTVMVKDDNGNPLKYEDVLELCDEEEIARTAPTGQTSVTAASTYSEETATVTGTSGDYKEIQGLKLYAGRFLRNVDVKNHTSVVVINAGLAIDVMGRMDVVGETIDLDGKQFQIIGVLEADENDTNTTENYEAYIPYSSLVRLSDGVSNSITNFCASASSEDSLDEAEARLDARMLARFSSDDNYTVINQSTVLETMQSVTQMMEMMLGGIAGISLLVGGIGIMNIMLVSVTERTREIGIRKAIGAGNGDILVQFLIEALMLSLIGWGVGVLLSVLLISVLSVASSSSDVTYQLSMNVVWISLAFSVLIGAVFGLYPANKAARMHPVDALRYI